MSYEAPPTRHLSKKSGDIPPPRDTYVKWGTRVIGFLLDLVPVLLIYIVGGILGSILGNVSDMSGMAVTILTRVVAVTFIVWNLAILQGRHGQCFGKSIVGIKCVSKSTGQPIGPRRQLVRLIAHLADLFTVIGWLFPLWDSKKQTFADKIAGTVVATGPKKSFREAVLALKL